MPSPVHSAHVGQELEVHYPWYPYFRRKVLVRRVEQRATGQFVLVEGPTSIVVSIAGWMFLSRVRRWQWAPHALIWRRCWN
jgi:hypothetical protein